LEKHKGKRPKLVGESGNQKTPRPKEMHKISGEDFLRDGGGGKNKRKRVRVRLELREKFRKKNANRRRKRKLQGRERVGKQNTLAAKTEMNPQRRKRRDGEKNKRQKEKKDWLQQRGKSA